MSKIKLLIADDHPTYREGLARMLGDEEDFEVAGIAADGAEAINLAKRLRPDVILIDVSMPQLKGTQAAKEIRKQSPSSAIIMLSAFDYEAFVLASLRAGARGYILKTAPLERLTSAIRLVYRGESVLDIKATEKLVRHLCSRVVEGDGQNGARFDVLYPRELEVLDWAAKGMSNKEIANELMISERTVQTHLVNIFRKLGANSRTQAVLYALREGWVNLDEPPKRNKN